jgi:mitogen-activated protein kinase 1/3
MAFNLPNWDLGSRYQLLRKIGKGTYGSVFEGKDKQTGEKVAIKNIKSLFEYEVEAKRMLREICIMRYLNHPNIVKIKDVVIPKSSDDFNNVFIVMEYAESDLKKLTKSPSFLDHSQVRYLFYQAVCGCRYMHSANVMHRDIKPANILINADCTLKICDFGLSRSYRKLNHNFEEGLSMSRDPYEDELTGGSGKPSRILTGHVVTRWYRAPEVILMEKEYGKEMDIWSLGCVFAEMLGMIRENVSQHIERTPLFPGRSCFPLSPDLNANTTRAGYPVSDHDQLNTIFQVVGTRDNYDFITDAKALRYVQAYPPTKPKDFREIFPGINGNELDLLTRMLSFNPRERITLDQAVNHPYFIPVRNVELEYLANRPVDFVFDSNSDIDLHTLKEMFRKEISSFSSL